MDTASVKRQKTTLPPAAAAHLYVHGTEKLGADGQSRWRVDGSAKNKVFVWEPAAAATETSSPGHAQAARAAARAARTAALEVAAGRDALAPPPPPPAAPASTKAAAAPAATKAAAAPASTKAAAAPAATKAPAAKAAAAAAATKAAAAAATKAAAAVTAAGDSDDAGSPEPLASDEFIVRELLERKVLPAKGKGGRPKVLFLVAWKGYPKDQATWEPRENLMPRSDAQAAP